MSTTKIGENTTKILKLLLFIIKLLFVASIQLSTNRKLNLPLTSSVYFVFFPLEMQKRLKQTKIYHAFSHFVWKETTHKPLKVPAARTLFFSVYVIATTCFDQCFFILCDTWKTLLFLKVYRSSETVLSDMLLLSLKPVYCKKSVFYALSPQQQCDVNMMLSSKIKLIMLLNFRN